LQYSTTSGRNHGLPKWSGNSRRRQKRDGDTLGSFATHLTESGTDKPVHHGTLADAAFAAPTDGQDHVSAKMPPLEIAR
jgi:hypothetical protein